MEYTAAYERLRVLFEQHGELINQFTSIHGEAVRMRNQLEATLRKRVQLIQVRLGEWGEDDRGFYCVFFVTVHRTDTTKPPESVGVTFTYAGSSLPIASVQIAGRSDALPITVATSEQGVRLDNIRPNFVGAKTVRLHARLQGNFNASTFDSSGIEAIVHG
jgi:hypothetical protein